MTILQDRESLNEVPANGCVFLWCWEGRMLPHSQGDHGDDFTPNRLGNDTTFRESL